MSARSQRQRKPARLPDGALTWNEASSQHAGPSRKSGPPAGEQSQDAEMGASDDAEMAGEEEEEEEAEEGEGLFSDSGESFAASDDGDSDDVYVPPSPKAGLDDLASFNIGIAGGVLPSSGAPLEASQASARGKKKRVRAPGFKLPQGAQGPEEWRRQAEQSRKMQPDTQRDGEGEGEVDEENLGRLVSAITSEAQGSQANVAQWKNAIAAEDANLVADGEEIDDYAFHQDLRSAQGFKRGKAQQGRKRRRVPAEQVLAKEVQDLLRDANMCFIDENVDEAIEKLEEVIRIEPAVRSAWSTLALCYEELSQGEKELQCRIVEAHLTPRPLDLWCDLARKSRDRGLLDQALYCFAQAIRASSAKGKEDVLDVMWEKACLQLDMALQVTPEGEYVEDLELKRKAAVDFNAILKLRPHNLDVMRKIIPLLVDTSQFERAIDLLDGSADYNMQAYPDPSLDPALRDEGDAEGEPTYAGDEIVTLADLLLVVGEPLRAIHVIRQGARWMQGRGDQEYWDEMIDDDREFDLSREDGGPEGAPRSGERGRRYDLAPVYALEDEMRIRLGRARAALGDIVEAKHHFSIWRLNADIHEHVHTFAEIADAYIEANQWELGCEIMNEVINSDEAAVTIENAQRLALCYQRLRNYEEAKIWYELLLQDAPERLEDKLALAEVYEELGERDRAIELVNEVVRARQAIQAQYRKQEGMMDPSLAILDTELEPSSTQLSSFFDELASQRRLQQTAAASSGDKKKRTPGVSRLEKIRLEKEREEEFLRYWERLLLKETDVFVEGWWKPDVPITTEEAALLASPSAESKAAQEQRFEATSDWMSHASRLIEGFRSTRQLFPSDKQKKFTGLVRERQRNNVDSQAESLMSRIRDRIVDDDDNDVDESVAYSTFRGIDFDDWIGLFARYAFVLAKAGKPHEAYEILEHLLSCNIVWGYEQRTLAIHLAMAACALYVRDFDKVFTTTQHLTSHWQFHTEPLRVINSIANVGGFYSLNSYAATKCVKNTLRRMRIYEAIVMRRPHEFNQSIKRWVVRGPLSKPGLRVGPKKQSTPDDDDEDEIDGSDDGHSAQSAAELSAEQAAETLRNADAAFEKLSPELKQRHRRPTVYNPINEAHYGGMLLATNSMLPSMGYWLRIFARQQNDPLVCLAGAVACLSRAMQRQVDNRSHLIVQGMSLLTRYRSLRGKSSIEAEYNFGRAMHHLGLLHLAVPHYQRALSMHDERVARVPTAPAATTTAPRGKKGKAAAAAAAAASQPEPDTSAGFDPFREAAYNLANIYVLSGSPLLARSLYERYLSI